MDLAVHGRDSVTSPITGYRCCHVCCHKFGVVLHWLRSGAKFRQTLQEKLVVGFYNPSCRCGLTSMECAKNRSADGRPACTCAHAPRKADFDPTLLVVSQHLQTSRGRGSARLRVGACHTVSMLRGLHDGRAWPAPPTHDFMDLPRDMEHQRSFLRHL